MMVDEEKETRYAIWCRDIEVATGKVRESWFKETGIVSLFLSEKAASNVAAPLAQQLNRSPFHTHLKFERIVKEYIE
jgi:hypothetical protein